MSITASTSPLLPNYPITNLFPRHSLNILCGAPCSGKHKLLQSELPRYLETGDFLTATAPAHPATGLPQIARVGYCAPKLLDLPPEIPQVTWASYFDEHDRPLTLEWLYEQFAPPRPQLLIADGFQMLMPGGKVNDNCEVARWCIHLERWCIANDITLLGTASTQKIKLKDGAYAPHDRILGASHWAKSSHTSIILDTLEPDPKTDILPSSRLITTLTHGPYPGRRIWYDLDSSGALVPTLGPPTPTEGTTGAWRAILEEAATTAQRFTTAEAIAWGTSLAGVSAPTVERWLRQMYEEGRLDRIGKGSYKWLDKPADPC